MLTLVLWSIGMAFIPIALGLVWALITGMGELMGLGTSYEFHEIDEFEPRQELRYPNSDILPSSVPISDSSIRRESNHPRLLNMRRVRE